MESKILLGILVIIFGTVGAIIVCIRKPHRLKNKTFVLGVIAEIIFCAVLGARFIMGEL